MHIEAMYARKDGGLYRRKKVPLADIELLPKFGVIALALTHEGFLCGSGYGVYARELPEGRAYGTDHISVVTTRTGLFFMDCWDDTELHHYGRSLSNPHGPTIKSPAAARRHSGETSVTFAGVYLPDDEWREAMDQMILHMGVPK